MSDYKKLFEGFKNYIKEEEIKEVTEEEETNGRWILYN